MREDFRTVLSIVERKRRIKVLLAETSDWCRPGVWRIEGPYARHKGTPLPDDLCDAVRAIRTRRVARELVERLAPPWRADIPDADSRAPGNRQCSIAYLSNGGNWKLFDLDNRLIWTRAGERRRMEREADNLRLFGAFFHIPAWRMVQHQQSLWRSDAYLDGTSMARCPSELRKRVMETLFWQWAEFARAAMAPPRPSLTEAAFATLQACAPNSIPALIARKREADIRSLGSLPLVPSHGDFSAQNIFLCESSPWIIDWDNAGRLLPAGYDMNYLIVREAQLGRRDLIEALLGGRFDQGLGGALASNSKATWHFDRLLLLLHGYMLRFHSIFSAGQRDASRQNIDALWNPLSDLCRSYL